MDKFKLTDNKKCGLTQIIALKDFGDVKLGDLGGWVECEKSLSQSGDAWVSGNARVYGDARVSGNAWVYGSPINIIGLTYNITIYCQFIQIGCELHTFEAWSKFTNKEILAMDGKGALKFWNSHKDMILKLSKGLQERERKYE
jgi:hypothetical protein